ncbi:MAG: hypothetical protein U0638_15865 [Phycisphaerales bacterium]
MPGCSDDGGFFPGMMTHNEGAVDYRVASLSPDSENPAAEMRSDAKPCMHGAPGGLCWLGSDLSEPYISGKQAKRPNAFLRVKVPEYVREAEDKLSAKKEEQRKAEEILSSAEFSAREAKGRLDASKAEADRIQKELTAATDSLTELQSKKSAKIVLPSPRPLSRKEWEEQSERINKIDGEVEKAAENEKLGAEPKDDDAYDQWIRGLDTAITEAKSTKDGLDNELTKANQTVLTRETDVTKYESDKAAAAAENERAKAVAKQAESDLVSARDRMTSTTSTERELVTSVRVTLKQAYLRKFRESGPVGEVAVLMTVKASRSGLGQQDPKAGRVVYYSEGVRKDAFMNFRDQPVYGPFRYDPSTDLQIRVSLLELDDSDNKIAGSMLKTLAGLGSIAYPPSSPVLGALDQIGEALLRLNGPDLEWDYLMRLSSRPPSTATQDANSEFEKQYDAWLRDGHYVLMRSDTTNVSDERRRIDSDVWNTLYLDPGTGVIYQWVKREDSAGDTDKKKDTQSSTSDAAKSGEVKSKQPAPSESSAAGGAKDSRAGEIPAEDSAIPKPLPILCPRCSHPITDEPKGKLVEYTGRSYLVFAVQTGFDSTELDLAQDAAELNQLIAAYSSGSDTLQSATESMAAAIQDSIKKLKDRKEQQQRNRNIGK